MGFGSFQWPEWVTEFDSPRPGLADELREAVLGWSDAPVYFTTPPLFVSEIREHDGRIALWTGLRSGARGLLKWMLWFSGMFAALALTTFVFMGKWLLLLVVLPAILVALIAVRIIAWSTKATARISHERRAERCERALLELSR